MRDHLMTMESAGNETHERPPRPSVSRRAFLVGSTTALATLSGCIGGDGGFIAAKRDESESIIDLSSGTIRVDAEGGHVTVREGTDDVIHVRVEKSGSLLSALSSTTVSSRREGDTALVESSVDGGGWFDFPLGLEITIDIPPGVAIESMRTKNGIARAEGVSAVEGATIQSENGNAIAKRLDGDIEVVTKNGRAVAEQVAGFVTARSETGTVTIRDCDGVDGASTETGTVSADVAAIRSDTTISSETGTVEAALASDLDAHVIAKAQIGTVEVGDALADLETNTQTYVEGVLGDGTHDLTLSTETGTVELSRLS